MTPTSLSLELQPLSLDELSEHEVSVDSLLQNIICSKTEEVTPVHLV